MVADPETLEPVPRDGETIGEVTSSGTLQVRSAGELEAELPIEALVEAGKLRVKGTLLHNENPPFPCRETYGFRNGNTSAGNQ